MADDRREAEFNPYAAPRSGLEEGTRPDWFRIVGTRVRFREYWRISSNPVVFLILAVCKVLRLRFAFQSGVHQPTRLDIVEAGQVPQHVWDLWREKIEACAAEGLPLRFLYAMPTIGTSKECFAAVMSSDDGRVIASLTYILTQVKTRTIETVQFGVGSRFADGRSAMVRDSRRYFDPPREHRIRVLRGRPVAEIIARLHAWVSSKGWISVERPVAELPRIILENEHAAIQNLVKRRVLVPMTQREFEKLSALGETPVIPPQHSRGKLLDMLQAVRLASFVVMLTAWASLLFGGERYKMLDLVLILGGFALMVVSTAARSWIVQSRLRKELDAEARGEEADAL